MAYAVKRYTFKDGKVMFEDRIAYANGDYVSLDDFEISMQKKNDEIESLKRQVKKLESIRMRCHESARDSFDSGNYGCLHIVTADELKTTKDVNDRTIELPFDALDKIGRASCRERV